MNDNIISDVKEKMRQLLKSYNADKKKSLDDIIDFHYQFEKIHPFQDKLETQVKDLCLCA